MPVLDLFSLAGNNALVTGASRGIGNACALALAQAGANLCLVLRPASDANEPPCVAALRAQLPSTTTIAVVYADLSDPAQVKAVFPQALARMPGGTIDVLVNCAGIQRRAPAVDFPESDWDDVSDIIDDVVRCCSPRADRGPAPPPRRRCGAGFRARCPPVVVARCSPRPLRGTQRYSRRTAEGPGAGNFERARAAPPRRSHASCRLIPPYPAPPRPTHTTH